MKSQLRFCVKIRDKLATYLELAEKEKEEILFDIKKNFYERNYMGVFLSSPAHLAVYFDYYVASRVLCYYDLFKMDVIREIISGRKRALDFELDRRRAARKGIQVGADRAETNESTTNILCIGSGPGSELISLFFTALDEQMKPRVCTGDLQGVTFSEFQDRLSGMQVGKISVDNVDIADWSYLQTVIENSLPSDPISTTFVHADILATPERFFTRDRDLVTFMFVLNELFTVSKQKTVRLLTCLIKSLKQGAYVLFVESAGSFSELSVGSKEFKVYQVLDGIKQLELVASEDSRWYRYPSEVNQDFGLNLVNMRYFFRLYRKC